MNKRSLYLFVFAIVIFVAFIGYLLVSSQGVPGSSKQSSSSVNQTDSTTNPQSATDNGQTPQSQVNANLTPPQVVRKFYDWYILNPRNPLTTRIYQSSPYLTDSFKQIISGQVASVSSDPNADDPVFCKVNKTKDVTISQENDLGNNTVEVFIRSAQSGKNLYRVALVNDGNTWKIDDVFCLP